MSFLCNNPTHFGIYTYRKIKQYISYCFPNKKLVKSMSEFPSANRLSLAYPKRSLMCQIAMQSSRLLRSLVHTTRVAPIALLIDGDNIACDLVAPILIEAGKFGGVVVRRVYGNWAQPAMQRWKEVSQHYSLQQMHHVEVNGYQKNATDIALVVDAMDLFYRDHFEHFCIVTSDSDYTPLAERLRAEGCFVLGIGRPATSPSFSRACTVFLTTEQLRPPMHQPRPVTTAPSLVDVAQPTQAEQTAQVLQQAMQALQSTQSPESSQFTHSREADDDGAEQIEFPFVAGELMYHMERETTSPVPFPAMTQEQYTEVINLLTDSYRAARRSGNEWVLVAKLGLEIRKRKYDFNANYYGQKDLSSLIRLYDSIFEIRKRSTGHPEIRMLR